MEPVKTADGRVTVPEEVITSMERNKLGLKGEPPQQIWVKHKDYFIIYRDVILLHVCVCRAT